MRLNEKKNGFDQMFCFILAIEKKWSTCAEVHFGCHGEMNGNEDSVVQMSGRSRGSNKTR